jgi:ferredoxin-NADP reductase
MASGFFHENLFEGDILDVKAPTGKFHLDLNRYAPVVLIGGGIGITPVLSMLTAICESGFKRETWFFYGVRNHREHIMDEFLQELARQHDNVHLHVCYSNPEPDDRRGIDYQHDGFVSVELMRRLLPSSNYEFYICGPPPMMESLTRDLREWGVPAEDIRFEAFGPATVRKAKAATGAERPEGKFTIEFARSNKTLDWDPAFESLLEFAEENGIPIDCGCRAGNCGTCLTAVKNGEVAYINEPGETPEEGSCLTCISVPKTDLTLDA